MEQALVFASIVLGVGIAFELENLNRLIRAENVRWHWAQPLFAVLILLLIMSYWWSIASRSEESITLGEFVPIMWTLVTMNLLAAISLPDRIGEHGVDLAAYYQRNRRYMWSLGFLSGLPHELQFLTQAAQAAPDITTWLKWVALDLVVYGTLASLIFIRRWWLVALGMAIVALSTVSWFSRSLG